MNIIGSKVSYLGFSLAGTHTLLSSLAALAYYNTSNFTIVNSTLSNNIYGFYSDESSKFSILDNEVYSNVKYGLDPHSGSKDFVIDSNHIFANGGQGIICSFKCKNVTITNNVVEYNIEGIGLHWLTNSSLVKNNIVKYNSGYGIYVKTNSYNNIVVNNTIIGNGNGIGLLDNSNENAIKSNFLRGNILEKNQVHEDKDSLFNEIENNTSVIK
jgi:parallel beta-helix repeat protein